MYIRLSLALLLFFVPLHADEWEDFVTAFQVEQGVFDRSHDDWGVTRILGNRLYWIWRCHKKNTSKQHVEKYRQFFVETYFEVMGIEPDQNNVLKISGFYNLMVENFDETVDKAKKQLILPYQERMNTFSQRLRDAGAIDVSKEQEEEFWKGHEALKR